MSNAAELKAAARRLRNHLADRQISITHSASLEAIAAAQGFKSWNAASAAAPATPAENERHVIHLIVRASASQEELEADVEGTARMNPDLAIFHVETGDPKRFDWVKEASARLERTGIETRVAYLNSDESTAAFRANSTANRRVALVLVGERAVGQKSKQSLKQARVAALFNKACDQVLAGQPPEEVLDALLRDLK